METTTGQLSKGLKQTISTVSALWALLGLPLMFGCFCGVLVLVAEGESNFSSVGLAVFGFSLVLLTGGAGSLVAWHASRSLAGKPSQPLRLFPAWLWAGGVSF